MATKYNTVEPLPKALPLTSENLKQYQVKCNQLKINNNNDTKRFCQDLVMIPCNQPEPSINNNKINKYYSPKRARPSSIGGQQIKNRRSISIKSNHSQRDHTCMESPRLLPFPYHNDSLFLPTVEHHRHQLRKVKSIASINSHHSSFLQQSSSTNSSHISTSRPSSTPIFPPRRQLSAPPKLSKKYHPASRLSSSIPTNTITTTSTESNIKSVDDSSSTMDTMNKNTYKKINNQRHSKKKNMVYNLLFKKVLKMVKKVSIFH